MLITNRNNFPVPYVNPRVKIRRRHLGDALTQDDLTTAMQNTLDNMEVVDVSTGASLTTNVNSGGGFWDGIGNFFTNLITPAANVTSDYLKYQATQNVVKSSPYYGYQRVYDPSTGQYKVVSTGLNTGFFSSSLTFPIILAGAGVALFLILKKKRS